MGDEALAAPLHGFRNCLDVGVELRLSGCRQRAEFTGVGSRETVARGAADFSRGHWIGTREKRERGVDRAPRPAHSCAGREIYAVKADPVMTGRRCGGVVVPHPLEELMVLEVSTEAARQAVPCCRFGLAFGALDK